MSSHRGAEEVAATSADTGSTNNGLPGCVDQEEENSQKNGSTLKEELSAASDLIKQAETAEQEKQLPKALHLYRDGIKLMLDVLKSRLGQTANLRQVLLKKIHQNLSQAENVKEKIQLCQKNNSKEQENGRSGSLPAVTVPDIAKRALLEETLRSHEVYGHRLPKTTLKELVVLPLKFPHLFSRRYSLCRLIVMFGPPGVGKTMLAKAIVPELPEEVKVFLINGWDLTSRYNGVTEKDFRDLFEYARETGPALMIIDDFEGLCSNRNEGSSEHQRRLKTEFLVQMQARKHLDTQETPLFILGITKNPVEMDSVIRRRVSNYVYTPLPDKATRLCLLKSHVGSSRNSLTESDFCELAEKTHGYSGSDIVCLCRDITLQPIREITASKHFRKRHIDGKYEFCDSTDRGAIQMDLSDIKNGDDMYIRPVSIQDVDCCIRLSRPSVSEQQIQEYYDFAQSRGIETQFFGKSMWEPNFLQELAKEVIWRKVYYNNCSANAFDELPLPSRLIDYVKSRI